MKALSIPDAPTMALALQEEIRRSHESRYDHRLHGVLLVAQGMTSPEVANLLGDAPRTVEYWVRQFVNEGLSGLAEAERSGRPRRLSAEQLEEIDRILRQKPSDVDISSNLWDGKTLSAFIANRFGISLGTRQCQRLFRQQGFRFRKPRPVIAHADPLAQEDCKKNCKD